MRAWRIYSGNQERHHQRAVFCWAFSRATGDAWGADSRGHGAIDRDSGF